MQDTQAIYFGKRESGISLIGAVPWGSHFCQFYQTQEDLLEILVPYLRAGLENHEFGLWVTDGPLTVEEAHEALRTAVPRFEEYVQNGQMEILSRDQWYTGDGELGPAIVSGLDKAISRGFDGLRLACHALPQDVRGRDARDAADAIFRYNVVAAFAYPRDQFDTVGLMAIVKNHRLALVRNAGRWEVIESSEAQSVKDALQRSEATLHSVFANMSEGFAHHRIVLDAGGHPCDYVFLEVNEAFERLTGLQSENLIGRKATQALPGIETDPADWIGTYGRVALTGAPAQFESYSQALRKWYSVSAFSPHKGFFAVTFSDITERKQAQEQLLKLNRTLKALSRSNQVLMRATEESTYLQDVCKIIVEDCGHAMVWIGYAEQDEAKSVRPVAHAGFEEGYLETLQITWADTERGRGPTGTAIRTGKPCLCRNMLTDPNFAPWREQAIKRGYASSIVLPLLSDGQAFGAITIYSRQPDSFSKDEVDLLTELAGDLAYGITSLRLRAAHAQMEEQLRRLNDQLEEEVQARTEELKDTVDRLQEEVGRRVGVEDTLRKRSQMLEAFFQHTITPLAFMDRHLNFVRVNEAYARADGKEPEYFAGKNHFALYPHDENRQIFEQVLQTKQPYFAYAKPFTYPDAPHRVTYWNWLLTPLLDEQGDVQFLVLNLEDVTERQKAFQELEHRARQLQKLTLEVSQAEDRERKRLAEILHDDLQQQLAAAKFHLSLLGHRVPKDKAVRQAVAQLDQILKDAIEKSRSLSHELSPAVLYQSDLGETFEWLARQLKTKHGLTVHVESRDRIDSTSEALKVFLFKTAQEVLFNVVKHARVREARLRIQRLRGSLWLTISDQGQGFDPRSLGRTGGFGLLSIRERIELLGGRMKIRSAKGRGSTFLITVPDGQEEKKVGNAEGKKVGGPFAPSDVLTFVASHPPSGPRLRVLLVDDHKVMREGLAALLNEQADLEVVGQAGNGREAVDLAYRLGPDVVVMDVAMPLMAGEEATRQIKHHLPGVRVVALSMFEETDMAEAMRQAGAETYLLKTAPSDELLAAIRGR
jgi:PAS domain S-box-containing protein